MNTKIEALAQVKAVLTDCLRKHGHTNGSRADIRASLAFLAQQEARKCYESCDTLFNRAKAAEDELNALKSQPSQQEVRVATALSDAIERITRGAIEQLKHDLNKVPAFFNSVNKDVRETLSIAHVNILNLPAMIDSIKRDHEIITQAVSALKSAPISKQEPSTGTLYQELLYAVAQKFPGESRHETALRYIREREARSTVAGVAMQAEQKQEPKT